MTVRRTRSAIGFAIAALIAASDGSRADNAGETVAAAVPHNVVELIASGTWMDADLNGTYRAVAVATGSTEEPAIEVYVQWLAAKADGGKVEIISSVPVKEFNDQKLSSASISMEAEIDGQADLIVTGQDSKTGNDVLISLRATKPGIYQIQTRAATPETPAAPASPAAPANPPTPPLPAPVPTPQP